MINRRLFNAFNILAIASFLGAAGFMGCEPPEEMMSEDWASDAESSGDDWSEDDEEFSTYIGATKADSAMTRKAASQGNSKSIRVLRESQRPLIGNEAIGHGTPQPWKPGDGSPEASEDDQ